MDSPNSVSEKNPAECGIWGGKDRVFRGVWPLVFLTFTGSFYASGLTPLNP